MVQVSSVVTRKGMESSEEVYPAHEKTAKTGDDGLAVQLSDVIYNEARNLQIGLCDAAATDFPYFPL